MGAGTSVRQWQWHQALLPVLVCNNMIFATGVEGGAKCEVWLQSSCPLLFVGSACGSCASQGEGPEDNFYTGQLPSSLATVGARRTPNLVDTLLTTNTLIQRFSKTFAQHFDVHGTRMHIHDHD